MNEIVHEFKQTGLTYSCVFPDQQLFFTIDHVRKNRDGIIAEFTVHTFRPNYDPHVAWGVINIVSLQSREQFWKSCKRLMPDGPDGEPVQWERLLNTVCMKIMMAERMEEVIKLLDLTKNSKPSPWLIKDVLYKDEPTVFYGDGASGKSRLAHAIGLSVQSGKTIVPGLPPVESGPVLYWDWESNEDRIIARTLAICAGAKIPPTSLFYKRGTLPLRDCVEDVADFCKREGVVLLIVDTMEMSMGGTKETGSDANDATIKLYAGLRMIGIASLLIDHVPTSELANSKARRQYGSIYKKNLARNVFEIRPAIDTPGTDKCFHIGVFNTKKNDDGALIPPIGLRVDWDRIKTSYNNESILSSDASIRLSTNQAVEQALRQSTTMLTTQQIVNITCLGETKIKSAVSRLLEKGFLTHVGTTYGWVDQEYEDV